jgi:hypothetical protein
MSRNSMRITVAALALAVGLTGAAQAEPFNIFSASKAVEAANGTAATVEQARFRGGHWRGGRHWHGRRWGWGPGIALGTFGLLAGAAAASSYYGPRYYCDPYYEYCGPRRVYRRYYRPYYYPPYPYY